MKLALHLNPQIKMFSLKLSVISQIPNPPPELCKYLCAYSISDTEMVTSSLASRCCSSSSLRRSSSCRTRRLSSLLLFSSSSSCSASACRCLSCSISWLSFSWRLRRIFSRRCSVSRMASDSSGSTALLHTALRYRI